MFTYVNSGNLAATPDALYFIWGGFFVFLILKKIVAQARLRQHLQSQHRQSSLPQRCCLG